MKNGERINFKFYLLIILPIILFIVITITFLNSFKIGEVICESQYGYCNIQVDKHLLSFEGNKYLSSKKEIEKYLDENSLIKESFIQFKLPNKIEIYVVERKASYAIKTSDNKYYLISSDGLIVGKSEFTSLPYITMDDVQTSVGSYIDTNQIFSLKVLRYLDFLYGVKMGVGKKDSNEYKIQEGPLVIFPISGDSDILIGALRLMIQNISKNTWEYSLEKAYNQITIDLRYKNPVIK